MSVLRRHQSSLGTMVVVAFAGLLIGLSVNSPWVAAGKGNQSGGLPAANVRIDALELAVEELQLQVDLAGANNAVDDVYVSPGAGQHEIPWNEWLSSNDIVPFLPVVDLIPPKGWLVERPDKDTVALISPVGSVIAQEGNFHGWDIAESDYPVTFQYVTSDRSMGTVTILAPE